MIAKIQNKFSPFNPLYEVWQNTINALDRNNPPKIKNELLPKKENFVFPLALLNKLEEANLALNHFSNPSNFNSGLWENLRRQKLALVSQLAEKGIYV